LLQGRHLLFATDDRVLILQKMLLCLGRWPATFWDFQDGQRIRHALFDEINSVARADAIARAGPLAVNLHMAADNRSACETACPKKSAKKQPPIDA
jgi:hypothetical protein